MSSKTAADALAVMRDVQVVQECCPRTLYLSEILLTECVGRMNTLRCIVQPLMSQPLACNQARQECGLNIRVLNCSGCLNGLRYTRLCDFGFKSIPLGRDEHKQAQDPGSASIRGVLRRPRLRWVVLPPERSTEGLH